MEAGVSISDQLMERFKQEIAAVHELQALNDLRVYYLGKKGIIAAEMSQISSLSIEQRKEFGAHINKLKTFITEAIEAKQHDMEQAILQHKIASENVDVTLPPRQYEKGSIHPLSKVIHDIHRIFAHLGFAFKEGPEIEDEWHNFEALNIPFNHPARQMQDTFYLDKEMYNDAAIYDDIMHSVMDSNHDENGIHRHDLMRGTLLRTHTSNVQIRYMQHNKPPYKVYSVGKVYRADYDATHTPMFHQIEGLLIDETANLCNLKWVLETFLQIFFEVDSVPIRFRPSYFPFTEPSFEVDVQCDRSVKNAIKIGEGADWMEILGCGMVNPKVLENAGVDSEKYQGFAFGIGVERLTMLKYNIPDLRPFFSGDIRWLKHFGFKSFN